MNVHVDVDANLLKKNLPNIQVDCGYGNTMIASPCLPECKRQMKCNCQGFWEIKADQENLFSAFKENCQCRPFFNMCCYCQILYKNKCSCYHHIIADAVEQLQLSTLSHILPGLPLCPKPIFRDEYNVENLKLSHDCHENSKTHPKGKNVFIYLFFNNKRAWQIFHIAHGYKLYLPKRCWKTKLFSILFSMVSIATLLFTSLVTSLLVLACSFLK